MAQLGTESSWSGIGSALVEGNESGVESELEEVFGSEELDASACPLPGDMLDLIVRVKICKIYQTQLRLFPQLRTPLLADLGFIYGLRLFKIVIHFGGVSNQPARQMNMHDFRIARIFLVKQD